MTWAEILTLANTNFRNTFTEGTKLIWLRNLLGQIEQLKFNRDINQAMFDITPDIQFYDLPTDCEKDDLIGVEIETGSTTGIYKSIPYQDPAHSELSSFYSIINDMIFISELPTEAKTGWFYYIPLPDGPTTATLGNSPPIPSAFHELFVHGLCEKMAGARGDGVRKNNFKSDYDTLLADYLMNQLNSTPEYPSPKDTLPRRSGYDGRTVATAASESSN